MTAQTASAAGRKPLDPCGRLHVPIGVANTLDALKTFVEAEGGFSPGFGSYGIYFWVHCSRSGGLKAPTFEGVKCEHGLMRGGLIPWSEWAAGDVHVRTEVCETRRPSPAGDVFIVAARAHLWNLGKEESAVSLYVALRPIGAAGGPVCDLAVSETGDALLVDDRAALVSGERPDRCGVLPTDTIGDWAARGETPSGRKATSADGDCSGALVFDVKLPPGGTRTLGFICPVFPGRRAVGHRWDGKSEWAQLDEAKPNPPEGGILQPDPGLACYRGLRADLIFADAEKCWQDLAGRAAIRLPDARWSECFSAIIGHVALCMNEGAPDVSVVNYNVFNRDGVYVANILQKSGHSDLAASAIDYFLSHPFNGRVYPEADNPGQILWIIGEHWLLTRDRTWLGRVYPAVRKLVAMIRYCRTAPGPHWVSATALDFGDALPPAPRQELKPGRCDGHHPEYTEAFDIAGLRRAALLARAMDCSADAEEWERLAASLFESYDKMFGRQLSKGYGSYSVLWPCRLYPFSGGSGCEQFKGVGPQRPTSWRYFPLATAHQGLLTGNRAAAWGTLESHLDHEQMRGWYAFDEGGKSGSGGWGHVRTMWDGSVAMPHGWAIAEVWLLLRDSLLFEDGDRLVLLPGVPPAWFRHPDGMRVESLPTYFGPCSLAYTWLGRAGRLAITDRAAPPGGFVLRIGDVPGAAVKAGGAPAERLPNGDFLLPAAVKEVEISF